MVQMGDEFSKFGTRFVLLMHKRSLLAALFAFSFVCERSVFQVFFSTLHELSDLCELIFHVELADVFVEALTMQIVQGLAISRGESLVIPRHLTEILHLKFLHGPVAKRSFERDGRIDCRDDGVNGFASRAPTLLSSLSFVLTVACTTQLSKR